MNETTTKQVVQEWTQLLSAFPWECRTIRFSVGTGQNGEPEFILETINGNATALARRSANVEDVRADMVTWFARQDKKNPPLLACSFQAKDYRALEWLIERE